MVSFVRPACPPCLSISGCPHVHSRFSRVHTWFANPLSLSIAPAVILCHPIDRIPLSSCDSSPVSSSHQNIAWLKTNQTRSTRRPRREETTVATSITVVTWSSSDARIVQDVYQKTNRLRSSSFVTSSSRPPSEILTRLASMIVSVLYHWTVWTGLRSNRLRTGRSVNLKWLTRPTVSTSLNHKPLIIRSASLNWSVLYTCY